MAVVVVAVVVGAVGSDGYDSCIDPCIIKGGAASVQQQQQQQQQHLLYDEWICTGGNSLIVTASAPILIASPPILTSCPPVLGAFPPLKADDVAWIWTTSEAAFEAVAAAAAAAAAVSALSGKRELGWQHADAIVVGQPCGYPSKTVFPPSICPGERPSVSRSVSLPETFSVPLSRARVPSLSKTVFVRCSATASTDVSAAIWADIMWNFEQSRDASISVARR